MTPAEMTVHDTLLVIAKEAMRRLDASSNFLDREAAGRMRVVYDAAFAELDAECAKQNAPWLQEDIEWFANRAREKAATS